MITNYILFILKIGNVKYNGYYFESNTEYEYNGGSCKPVNTNNATIGFYWNGYQYNKVSQFDGQKFSSVTPVEVVTSNYCDGKMNQIVDIGYNIVFCNGNGEAITLGNTENKIIFTRGISNTLFNNINKYYALRIVNKYSLVLDTSISMILNFFLYF